MTEVTGIYATSIMNSLETLKGRVKYIRFRNEENFYTVMSFQDAIKGEVTVVGEFLKINVGDELSIRGQWISHPKYGKQFKVEAYDEKKPDTEEGILAYLSSGLIRGIGPKLAEKIVESFGERALEIIEKEPNKLMTIDGIGATKRDQIYQSFIEHRHLQNIVSTLKKYGLTLNMCLKIYKAYGSDAVRKVEKNPYSLSEELFGVGFRRADEIALKVGIEPHSPLRVQAAIKYVLSANAQGEGHLYLPKDVLVKEVSKEINQNRLWKKDGNQELPVSDEEIRGAIFILESGGSLVLEEDRVFLTGNYEVEASLASSVKRLLRWAEKYTLSEERISEALDRVEEETGIRYAPLQKEAVVTSLRNGLTLITGGPGTGKTTVVKAVIGVSKEIHGSVRVLLTAPTGRAAKRLSEVTGQEAKTIHRLLEYTVEDGAGYFNRDEQNPLTGDLLIVDETSMLDAYLANSLFMAIPQGMRVVLVGDADQLPSVGPGSVLRDVIDSGVVPTIQLNQVFRQEEASSIVLNAHRINNGQRPQEFDEDTTIIYEDEPLVIQKKVLDVVKDLKTGLKNIDDLQVIAPMYRGETGVAELNKRLQEILNPAGVKQVIRGDGIFRIGDKVMCIRNNYQKGDIGVFNGNIGIIKNIKLSETNEAEEDTLDIDFDSEIISYGRSEWDELVLAYAVTVHKSQGSEFGTVIVVLSTQHYVMLQRNLFYTGVTRAKRRLFIIGSPKAINIAVRNNKVAKRYTTLAEKLKLSRKWK